MTSTTSEAQESLEKSVAIIEQQILLMRKCLDVKHKKNRLMDALKHASTFLSELRTNVLTPKQYYELYILLFDGLNYLSLYLKETHLNNHLADLYELVQYAGNIIPRLYLMITVGTVYISIPGAPVKEVLKDLMDMARGVQHPIRGLFLRYYMNQRTKDLLPTEIDDRSGNLGSKGDRNGENADKIAGNNAENNAGNNSDITDTQLSQIQANLDDSVQFVITNFIEMNKLWVRLQHQGHSSERLKRLLERKELQILVGTNLVRLSQMEHLQTQYYKEQILPVVLEQIVQCRDVLVQEYLLDVIIQVSPDEFQLATLDEFLDATFHLHPNASINKIVQTLIRRLISFRERGDVAEVQRVLSGLELVPGTVSEAKEEELALNDPNSAPDVPNPASSDSDLFSKIFNYILALHEYHPDIDPVEFANILHSVVQLSIAYYPNNVANLDKIYGYASDKFAGEGAHAEPPSGSPEFEASLKRLLLAPITGFSLHDLVKIHNYHLFLASRPAALQKTVSVELLDRLLLLKSVLTTEEDVLHVFQLLSSVVKGEPKKKKASKLLFGADNSDNEQNDNSKSLSNDSVNVIFEKLSQLLHLLYNKDPVANFELLQTAKHELSKNGGASVIRSTYPTLIQLNLKLIRKLQLLKKIDLHDDDSVLQVKQMFNFASQCTQELYELSSNNGIPSLCLNLNLLSAQLADQVQLCDIANEFFTQSFVIYEESIIDSRLQYQSILSIIGKLHQVHNLIAIAPDSYDNLITKTALYGSKLLKKADQCRGVYLLSHLWWIVEEEDSGDQIQPIKKDNKRVLECLQKSLRIADTCLDTSLSLELFIEILNRCLYYFIHGNEVINVQYINGLIELIENNLKKVKRSRKEEAEENGDDDEQEDDLVKVERHFQRTLDYIEVQKTIDERFQGINATI